MVPAAAAGKAGGFNWRRLLKVVVIIIGGIAALAVIGMGLLISNPEWFMAMSPYPYKPKGHERHLTQFTASPGLVIFPVDVSPGTIGLVVVDRETGRTRLIQQKGMWLLVPRLSRDGKRLLIVRQDAATTGIRELLVCQVVDWQCRVLWRTKHTIAYPVEIDRDTVLYFSSPPTTSKSRGTHYLDSDFYLVRAGSEPVRLSHFTFTSVYALAILDGEIVFSADQNKLVLSIRTEGDLSPASDLILPERDFAAPAYSRIFALPFDISKPRIETPAKILEPLFLMKAGLSTRLAASEDGRLVAFINRARSAQFDLVIADRNGKVRKHVITPGFGFSTPTFVGRMALANELTQDALTVRVFDVDSNTENV
ncbi:MAG: hypothetical protein ACOY17_09115, partial [Pseudomonadota bacterium]